MYAAALWFFVQRRTQAYRWAGTIGLLAYLVHVFFAFAFFYDWSHTIAFRETARQSKELFGVAVGAGLYLNYAFTALWLIECGISWTRRGAVGNRKARALGHAFLTFIVLNGSMVVWALRWLSAT